jgi:hypothetical protein
MRTTLPARDSAPDDRIKEYIAHALLDALAADQGVAPLDDDTSDPDRLTHATEPSVARAGASRLLDQAALDPLRAAVTARALNAVADVVTALSGSTLTQVASAPSNYDLLVEALRAAVSAGPDENQLEEDRLLQEARLRGAGSRKRILETEGGVLSVRQVADHLNLSRQAVDERRKKGKLIGLRTGGRSYAYPAWQLSQQGVLPGLERTLGALRGWDPWTQAAFMLNPNARLWGNAPLQELRAGNVDEVLRAAQAYGEHSA